MSAPFRIPQEARKYFGAIRNELAVDFDIAYLCAMVGMDNRKKSELPIAQTVEIVNYFPDKYRERGKLIVALFIATELAHLGVPMEKKKLVHDHIRQLVDPMSPSSLSEVGVREFNKYCFGGFEKIIEHIEERPVSLGAFLVAYSATFDRQDAE